MFWHKKNVNDAMTLAMDASADFGDVASQAAAGKFNDAAASLKKASATCGGCHAAHRENAADGSWKIKQRPMLRRPLRSALLPSERGAPVGVL